MEEEHEVYGGDIPEEVEGDMDAGLDEEPDDLVLKDDPTTDEVASKVMLKFRCAIAVFLGFTEFEILQWFEIREDADVFQQVLRVVVFRFVFLQELEEMKKRLKEMEEEAAALRDMQAKVEKEMSAAQGQFKFDKAADSLNEQV